MTLNEAAIAVGNNDFRQTNIPALLAGVTYTRVAAGGFQTVLLRAVSPPVAT